MPNKIDLTGQRFGRLTVVKESGKVKSGSIDRVTFKFPLRMRGKINLLVLGAIYRYCDETPCEENTMRGRFNEESTSVYMEYDNGVHAVTIPIQNLFVKEVS